MIKWQIVYFAFEKAHIRYFSQKIFIIFWLQKQVLV